MHRIGETNTVLTTSISLNPEIHHCKTGTYPFVYFLQPCILAGRGVISVFEDGAVSHFASSYWDARNTAPNAGFLQDLLIHVPANRVWKEFFEDLPP